MSIRLSEASQELKKGAAEQNMVLRRLMEVMGEAKEEITPKVEKVEFPPGCIRSRLKPTEEEESASR